MIGFLGYVTEWQQSKRGPNARFSIALDYNIDIYVPSQRSWDTGDSIVDHN